MLYWPGAIMVYNISSGRVQKAILRARRRRRRYLPEQTLSLRVHYNEEGWRFYSIPYHPTGPTSVAFTNVP